MIYFDFIVKTEHVSLRNIFNEDKLKISNLIENVETYYDSLKKFIQITLLLDRYYNRNNEIE